jgi:GNAT superfamily N-acetyltransferase
MTTIAVESPRQTDVLALMAQADEYALSIYSAEDYHCLDIDGLDRPGVSVLVARTDAGRIAGMVALVDNGDATCEIKRMFVAEHQRGLGIASALLVRLAELAAAASAHRIRLETGWEQPDAIALYLKQGYVHIPNFGPYVGDASSVCMELTIPAG